jgi:hypothetical protein
MTGGVPHRKGSERDEKSPSPPPALAPGAAMLT